MFDIKDAFSSEFIYKTPTNLLWESITKNYDIDEEELLISLLDVSSCIIDYDEITKKTIEIINRVRSDSESLETIDSLLSQYSLDTKEGVLLMCLAEALLRIPDSKTADSLIKDKLTAAQWEKHLNKNESLLVNASTWGIMLTGKIIELDTGLTSISGMLGKLINKLGEPIIRKAIFQSMKIIGKHFVLGKTIKEALSRSNSMIDKGYSYSFDMLGEAAITKQDAERYFEEYHKAIHVIGNLKDKYDNKSDLGISIKLSALHPRYEVSQKTSVLSELVTTVLKLIATARSYDVPLTIDAEEQDKHELMLEVFHNLYTHEIAQGWGKLGLVIQAYGKRAIPSLCWLIAIAKEQGDIIPVRLVKGAYWDTEIKHSQELGTSGYPVYTRKEATDISYLVCINLLFSEVAKNSIYPQFATHNAYTIACISYLAQKHSNTNYEFQRLHGMGKSLYKQIIEKHDCNIRIYAPVGSHEDLLPYLVRRLLENGANSSFVHQLLDKKVPIANLTAHPTEAIKNYDSLKNDKIPLPPNIFGESRKNSMGYNINIKFQMDRLTDSIMKNINNNWQTGSIINGNNKFNSHKATEICCSYNKSQIIGKISFSSKEELEEAVCVAVNAFNSWNIKDVMSRSEILNKFADLLEEKKAELISLCHQEAGKTIQDSIDEIREAVDFCRYYAKQAQIDLAPINCDGPTGESNILNLSGRGVFLCISPWNFPLAIFVGQIVAALAVGNTVIAKPAEQTSLIAGETIKLMHQAGVPKDAVNLIIAQGSIVGKTLVNDDRISGIAFTGSTETAKLINRTLANRDGAIVPFIAETGGQNAMIVDSTSLPEQVAQDVVTSAFSSAGQRCSALRVLYLQEDIADRIIELLKGIIELLIVGNPCLHRTDVGPVIDFDSKKKLLAHISRMKQEAKLIAEAELPEYEKKANYVPPTAFEIATISQLQEEIFGPILHIIKYKSVDIDEVINDINNTGFGLTFGIHSRNNTFTKKVSSAIKAGNIYVNRNQIGASVGVQPFGGQGLSGTGPKAGGPNYLKRFAVERTLTVNITAIGGNPELLSL